MELTLNDEELRQIAVALLLYQRLNNDNRAGIELTEEDWGQCYNEGERAINLIPSSVISEARSVFRQPPFRDSED